jgi:hypothetical protein
VSGSAGGGLEDTTHQTRQDTSFDSNDAQVDYAMNIHANNGATDTITVVIFNNGGTPQAPIKGSEVGQAQATVTVTVSPTPCGALPQPLISPCADATLSSTTVRPGRHLGVTTVFHDGLICGFNFGATVNLNGVLIESAALDGSPADISSGSVIIPPGPDKSTHTVDFVISPNQPDECPISTPNPNPNAFPTFTGPWVVVTTAGVTELPFKIQE